MFLPKSIRNQAAPFLVLALVFGVSNVAAQQRTLEEARALGLRESNFLNQKARAATVNPEANLDAFRTDIGPILKKACAECHGADTQEGNVRIDALSPDLVTGKDVDWWLEVLAVLTNGEMPPPDADELSDQNRGRVIDWLSNEIHIASTIRRETAEHSSFRRMTRYEFNYALQDLLGLPYDFARDLPPEANSEDGFQNSSDQLHMSVSQLETYRQAARKALTRAVGPEERPPVLHWSITMKQAARINWDEQQPKFEKAESELPADQLTAQFKNRHPVPHYKDLSTGRTVRAGWGYGGAKYALAPSNTVGEVPEVQDMVAVIPKSRNQRLTIELGNKVPDEGTMRVRVRAARVPSESKRVPSMQLYFGWQASNEGRAVMRVSGQDTQIPATPDDPQFYQWDVPLGDVYPRNSVRKSSKMGAMPSPSEYIRLANSSEAHADIQIDYVQISAPVYDQWPPVSYKKIFIASENRNDQLAYAREVIAAFMERAWRRHPTETEVEQKVRLFEAMRDNCDRFETAIVEVLAAVLASPNFLYVSHENSATGTKNSDKKRRLTDHQLATRLSMFLWSSIPDAELLRVANAGQLSQPKILSQQVKRLVSDPRSRRLSDHFVQQWLDMQLLDFLNSKRLPDALKEAMQREPKALFHEILNTDASVLDFIHADYTMANERLAAHYGVRNVRGNDFRRVNLNEVPHRGGLLTQAGLLAMNSAGEDSHPLKRGVWLLESLLNDPPPPPPPAVPEIDLADPEIAKLTLKEQIKDHRNHAACMSCHAKIDPWGIAFENYGALGQWRDQVKGKPVDAASMLFNDQKLDGMPGLKRFLLENRQDQFVRAMVHKLATYALGRPLTFADRASIDAITADVRQRGNGLATMIEVLVTSDLFQSK